MEYTFTVANFEEEVLNSPLPVLVDFYADWCNPCKMMAPTVAKLAEAYEGKVKVGKINVDENGNITLGDEMLTPDSSRFWPAEGYEPGHSQPSFDKQFARDWLTSHPGNDWTLPEEIVQKTIDKYLQSYKMLTGKEL